MTQADSNRTAVDETTAAEHFVNNLTPAAKVEAALMLMALRYGEQHGHWSGDPARLEDALWERYGIEGATLEIDIRQLPCVEHWCVLGIEVRDGKLVVKVDNTVVK